MTSLWKTRICWGYSAVALMALFVTAGCVSGTDGRDGSSSPPTPTPIDTNVLFEAEAPCDFFEIESARDRLGFGEWEEGSPKADPTEVSLGNGMYGSCSGRAPFGEGEHVYISGTLFTSTDADWLLSLSDVEPPRSFEDLEETASVEFGAPWAGGSAVLFTDGYHRSEYEIDATGIGDGYAVSVHAGYAGFDDPISYCPELDEEAGCMIDPEVVMAWIEKEYLPMIFDKMKPYTEG